MHDDDDTDQRPATLIVAQYPYAIYLGLFGYETADELQVRYLCQLTDAPGGAGGYQLVPEPLPAELMGADMTGVGTRLPKQGLVFTEVPLAANHKICEMFRNFWGL